MTGLVNILVEVMTTDERTLLTRAARGQTMSEQEYEMLNKLRLVEVGQATGQTQLSNVGKEVSSRI